VGDHRRVLADVEQPDPVADGQVLGGEPLVLTQVLGQERTT